MKKWRLKVGDEEKIEFENGKKWRLAVGYEEKIKVGDEKMEVEGLR